MTLMNYVFESGRVDAWTSSLISFANVNFFETFCDEVDDKTPGFTIFAGKLRYSADASPFRIMTF